MNKYYCVKCEDEFVIRSSEPTLDYKCSCDPKPVKYRLVDLKGKPNPIPVVSKKPLPVEVEVLPTPAPKPKLTKLDVSTGTSQL